MSVDGYIARPDGSEAQLYDLKEDPDHDNNIAKKATDTANRMLERLLTDAGGKITDYDVNWRY